MVEATSETDDVIARWANRGPGWELLDCEPILVPFVRLSMDVLELTRTRMAPLDLFALRAIREDIVSIGDLAGVLGLDPDLAEECVIDLCRQDLVHRGQALRLTDSGIAALEGNLQSPQRVQLDVAFDKVLYEAVSLPVRLLRHPRDFKELGWFELPPARRVNPKVADLDPHDLDQVTRTSRRGGGDIIAIHSLTPRRFVVPGHLLIWQAASSQQLDYAVVVAGAISDAHSAAVDRLGGLDYLKVEVDISVEEIDPLVEAFGTELAAELTRDATSLEDIERLRERTASREREVELIQREVLAEDVALDGAAAIQMSKLLDEIDDLKRQLREISIRFLDTVECREHFRKCRQASVKRLLVVAPWLTGRVVDRDFVREIESLCGNGVEVHIGWGYPEEESDGRKVDTVAEERLTAVAKRFKNLTLGFLGDTHEKILVSDDIAVVGSFNWLSYGGRTNNRQQRLRRESALYVRMQDKADLLYQKNRERIDRAAAGGKSRTPEGYGTRASGRDARESSRGPEQGQGRRRRR